MDGAMGTELIRAGLRQGECPESWNLKRPEAVRSIHRAYVHAGARCLVTNTFQSNPAALAKHGLSDQMERINRTAIDLARSVCGGNDFVLASIGPMEWNEEAVSAVVKSLRLADAILLETWSDMLLRKVLPFICNLIRDDGISVLASLTFTPVGLKAEAFPEQFDIRPQDFAEVAKHLGATAIGVNCGRAMGMAEIVEVIRGYREATDLPLFARPNAGTPTRAGDGWVYPHRPESMAAELPKLLAADVRMVGGCCGTGPDHIGAFRPIVEQWNARPSPKTLRDADST